MDRIESKEHLQMHLEALYVMDGRGRMAAINEPWDQAQPAPALVLGWTVHGDWCLRLGANAPEALVAAADELGAPFDPEAWVAALNVPVRSRELCYAVPELLGDATIVTPQNIDQFELGEFAWLRDEIATAQPCAALVADGRMASLCRSVRISPRAHEAGIETLPQYRGQGCAAQVLARWARAVRAIGCAPLYSTTADNLSSQRVAQKAGLVHFGSGISLQYSCPTS